MRKMDPKGKNIYIYIYIKNVCSFLCFSFSLVKQQQQQKKQLEIIYSVIIQQTVDNG